MLRVIALSIALIFSLGAIIPLATNYSEAGPRFSKKKKKKLKKYSRAWWRAYKAREKRNKTLAARRRALRARQLILARQASNGASPESALYSKQNSKVADFTPALLPSGETAPPTWKRGQATTNELQFRVDDGGGRQIGTAAISVVGPAMGADSGVGRSKSVGGVSVAALRRTVIDRMMKEEGWIVNDFQKDVNGKKIYVVVAASPGAGGQVQNRTFYFTEVEGKIYSLATNAPNETSERLAEESEKVINSLQRRTAPAQQAGLR